jgi:Tfp pilus assembly protein PilN
MMIHINLLPVRQEKKREVGRQFLVVVGGALFIGLLGNWLWYDSLASDEKKNAQRIAGTQARIAELRRSSVRSTTSTPARRTSRAKLAILADLRGSAPARCGCSTPSPPPFPRSVG